jgi:hypothetical protein
MKGGWIPKSKVGGYLVKEWDAGDPNTAGSWKIHSPAIQKLRDDINVLIKADKLLLEAGWITENAFLLKLTSFLLQITNGTSTEALYDKRDEKLEAEQVAEEHTDYEAYIGGEGTETREAAVAEPQDDE